MHRFFVPSQTFQDDRVMVRGALVHQLRDVLRMRPGDEIALLDNTGWAYRVELATVERDIVRGRVLEKWKLETEPRTHITLYQGVLKGQKFDWVLQKGTDLGISAFVPMLCSRSVMSSVDDINPARVDRWERIIAEAAEQSGRAVLPRLTGAMNFSDACAAAGQNSLSLIPWENERSTGLAQALKSMPETRHLNLFVGPEGGFTDEEIAFANKRGLVSVSLGPRILRAETAGLVAASAVLYAMGDMG